MPDQKDFYETKGVAAGRDSYVCSYCEGVIAKGQPSEVHKYYPEFHGYRTHPKCSKGFFASDMCNGCCENFDGADLTKLGKKKFCEDCYTDEKLEFDAKAVIKKVQQEKKDLKTKNTLKYQLQLMKDQIKGAE